MDTATERSLHPNTATESRKRLHGDSLMAKAANDSIVQVNILGSDKDWNAVDDSKVVVDDKPDWCQRLDKLSESRGNVIQTDEQNPSEYSVGKKVGEGSFGVVFEGVRQSDGRQVAIKFEPRKSDAPQLRDEFRAYKVLAGCEGIPTVYYFGQHGLHNILIIDLLGPSLENRFDDCGRKFTSKTVAMLARRMLSRVKDVHEKNLIYRDIKPDNFLLGRSGAKDADEIHLIDVGMVKQYRDPKTQQHIPYREGKSLTGTARYMSINTHLGREQSRRDDLEALGHVFLYFLRGDLPWQGIRQARKTKKYAMIGQKKQDTAVRDLCKGFPEEFGEYLDYVRSLGFEDTPDYEYLQGLFVQVLENMGEVDDGKFDWKAANVGPSASSSWAQCDMGSRKEDTAVVTRP